MLDLHECHQAMSHQESLTGIQVMGSLGSIYDDHVAMEHLPSEELQEWAVSSNLSLYESEV